MQDSSPVELRFHRLQTFTPDELEFIISHTKGTLTLKVLCPSIGSTQSYEDVAADLLDALFIGETVAKACSDGSFYEAWDHDEKCKTIHFVLTPHNPDEMAKKLQWLSNLFAEAEDDSEKRLEVIETVSEFRDQFGLFEKKHFPRLLENYFANYMIGLDEESEIPEDVTEVDKEDSIQIEGHIYEKYRYIRSFHPHDRELEIYCSTEASTWIILSDSLLELAKLDDLLSIYRSALLKPIELQEASVIADLRFDTLAFNHVEAVKYPFEQLTKAQECIAEVSFIKTGKTVDLLKATKVKKNLLSSYGNFLIVVDQMAQYLFFKDLLPTIPETTLGKMAESSSALKSYFDNREGHLNQRAQQTIDYQKKTNI